MKKLAYLFILLILYGLKTTAQNNNQPVAYKVPDAYRFDHKVVYEISREDDNTPETATYYFTENGDYMSMMTSESKNDKDMNFMVRTKDGLMITFGEEPAPDNSDKTRKVLKVMDMRSMMKGIGEGASAYAKTLHENDKGAAETKKSNDLDNFSKTGKTKQIFGYTAEEYSKEFTKDENGKEHSGTVSVWYAKVDFDPEMMFSMGMGDLAGGKAQSGMQGSHSNNMLGIGLTKKNYMLMEMDFVENGGKSGSAMKVAGIEKTSFTKSTEGYYIKNYSGMSMKEMMQKESEDK